MQDPLSIGTEIRDKPAVILVGNPNVGKSVVFNYLTGRYAVVSNFPGTTVEVSRGKLLQDSNRAVIDTPGVNSLHPQSLDEKVTRDILLSSFDRQVLQVADAKNLRRGLTITTQLAEMGLPVILELNLMDEAKRRGVTVSGAVLAERICIPVIETVATEKKGLKNLDKALDQEPRVPEIHVHYPEIIEDTIERISELLPDLSINSRAVALLFLADPMEAAAAFSGRITKAECARAAELARETQSRFSHPLSYIIGVSRSRVVDQLLDTVYLKDVSLLGEKAKRRNRVKSLYVAAAIGVVSVGLYGLIGKETLGEWGLHPLLLHAIGLFILFAALPYRALVKLTTHHILGALFLLEILYMTYKFVGVFGAGTLVDFLESKLFGQLLLPPFTHFLEKTVPSEFVVDLLVGDYGIVSMGLTYSIAIVLPIVATFFVAFGILEDSGYLPRLSVIADRVMRRMGLNGKAVLPMVLGLGCDTMATLTTRILDSRKERLIATLLLALGVPCSAQLGVIMAMAAGSSIACVTTVIVVVIAQLFIVGSLSNRMIKGRTTDFIVELPPLRVPQFANIWIKTWHRVIWFLKEAVPLFIIGTFVLFVLARLGALTMLEIAFQPVIGGLLDLPVESTAAFIVGFFRRDYGAAGLFDLYSQGMLSNNQVAVSMVVITLFVPCIAQFFVMIKERGLYATLVMVAFILPFSIFVGTLLNLFLRVTGIQL